MVFGTWPLVMALPLDDLKSIQTGTLRYSYKGIPTLKGPFDLALYSMLLWNVKPRTIVEIGSLCGGSALWFYDTAKAMDLDCTVTSIDLNPPSNVMGPHFIRRNARDLDLDLSYVRRPLLVIEDSDHKPATVSAVLSYFEPHMRSGEYIVVEDGNASDLYPHEHPSGPLAAIRTFLTEHSETWEVDRRYCDWFGPNMTWNVDGYLRRK